jgi:secreted trypsin-like serine protease
MMKFTAFIALAALVACARAQLDVDASGINGTASVSDLIAHGQEARQGQFPYAAKLLWNERSHCSGSLIAPRTILTAAHCVKGDDGKILDVSKYAIYIGNVDYKKAAKYSVKVTKLKP